MPKQLRDRPSRTPVAKSSERHCRRGDCVVMICVPSRGKLELQTRRITCLLQRADAKQTINARLFGFGLRRQMTIPGLAHRGSLQPPLPIPTCRVSDTNPAPCLSPGPTSEHTHQSVTDRPPGFGPFLLRVPARQRPVSDLARWPRRVGLTGPGLVRELTLT